MSACIILHYKIDLQQLHSTRQTEESDLLLSVYCLSMHTRTRFPGHFGDILEGRKGLKIIFCYLKRISIQQETFMKMVILSNGNSLGIYTNKA